MSKQRMGHRVLYPANVLHKADPVSGVRTDPRYVVPGDIVAVDEHDPEELDIKIGLGALDAELVPVPPPAPKPRKVLDRRPLLERAADAPGGVLIREGDMDDEDVMALFGRTVGGQIARDRMIAAGF